MNEKLDSKKSQAIVLGLSLRFIGNLFLLD